MQLDERSLLLKSLFKAGRQMGLSDSETSLIVGFDESVPISEINPGSSEEARALSLIRCYQCLYNLTGGESSLIEHWLRTKNKDIGDIPVRHMSNYEGLDKVQEYLEALSMR